MHIQSAECMRARAYPCAQLPTGTPVPPPRCHWHEHTGPQLARRCRRHRHVTSLRATTATATGRRGQVEEWRVQPLGRKAHGASAAQGRAGAVHSLVVVVVGGGRGVEARVAGQGAGGGRGNMARWPLRTNATPAHNRNTTQHMHMPMCVHQHAPTQTQPPT